MAEGGNTTAKDPSLQVVSIGNEGGTVVSRVDSRITVTFPPGTLDNLYRFKFTFEKIDVDRYEVYKQNDSKCASIRGFSGILRVKNNMPRIPGPVTLTLPLLEESGDSKDYDVIFIRMKDYLQRSLADPLPASPATDYYSIQINDFSILTDNFSAWKVKKGVQETDVIEAAKYISGQISLCNFLSYINIDNNTPWMTLNSVDIVHLQSATDSYEREGLTEIRGSRSACFALHDNSRFKIGCEMNMNPAPSYDKKLVRHGLTFRADSFNDGVRFPFTVISSPKDKSILTLVGKAGSHSISFRLAWFDHKEPKPRPVIEEEEEEEDDEEDVPMYGQYVHVGEGIFAKTQSPNSPPPIRVSPPEFRSEVINSLKKERGQFISEICNIASRRGLEYDLHIPVNPPDTRLHPNSLYNVFVVNGSERIPAKLEEWPHELKKKAKSKFSVQARVGNWTSLAVVADDKKETLNIPRGGVSFSPEIDNNIVVKFDGNKSKENESIEIKVKEIDQNKLRGYRRENPDGFGPIRGITSSIFLKSNMGNDNSIRNIDVTLPIRDDSNVSDNTDVILIQCDKQGLREVPVERSGQGNYYRTREPTSLFQWATVVRREKDKSSETLSVMDYLNGNRNLCKVMSFIRFDKGRALVRVDCASTFMADEMVKRHQREGFMEIPSSRSSDRKVENKEKLKISLKGNLHIPYGVPKELYRVTFLQYSVSNYTTFPIAKRRESDASDYSVIDIAGGRDFTRHMFTFILDECGNTLSNESMSVLVEQMTWEEWQRVGEQLSVTLEQRDLKGKTDQERSQRLLSHWVRSCKDKDINKVLQKLVTALQSTGHDKIASAITEALAGRRTLTRNDFIEYNTSIEIIDKE